MFELLGKFRQSADVQYVECHDPYDIRPYVRAAIDRGTALTRANGKPSVILLGENHKAGTHLVAVQLAVKYAVQAMQKMKNVTALGLEVPHQAQEDRNVLPRLQKRILQNPEGRYVDGLKHFQRNFYKSLCGYDESELFLFFNDAAKFRGVHLNILDASDARTLEEMKALGCDPKDLVYAVSVEGVTIRNKVIVQHILEDLERSAIGLYVQALGSLHVKEGSCRDTIISERYACEWSVETGLLESGRVNIVSVFPSLSLFNFVTKQAKAQNADNTIVAEGMNQRKYRGGLFEDLFQDQRCDMRRIRDATQGDYKIF